MGKHARNLSAILSVARDCALELRDAAESPNPEAAGLLAELLEVLFPMAPLEKGLHVALPWAVVSPGSHFSRGDVRGGEAARVRLQSSEIVVDVLGNTLMGAFATPLDAFETCDRKLVEAGFHPLNPDGFSLESWLEENRIAPREAQVPSNPWQAIPGQALPAFPPPPQWVWPDDGSWRGPDPGPYWGSRPRLTPRSPRFMGPVGYASPHIILTTNTSGETSGIQYSNGSFVVADDTRNAENLQTLRRRLERALDTFSGEDR